MKNIILIGFMGSGKSTVGRMLADKRNFPFIDTDDLIEERAGKAIKDMFRQEGEAAFRTLEKKVVREVSLREGQVIACGGGVVLDDENVQNLKEDGVLIYLKVSPAVACQRTQAPSERPLLDVSDPQDQIKRLLCIREEIYEKVADLSIDTSNLTTEQVVEEIEGNLKQRGVTS